MDLLLDENFLRYYNQDLIAKAGIKTIYDQIITSSNDTVFDKIFKTKEVLLRKNPENIVLRNFITYFLSNFNRYDFKESSKKKYFYLLRKLNGINTDIAEVGNKKIKPSSKVFVHSINNQIYSILKKASRYKDFEIRTIEHSPFKFGEYLSKKLKNHNNNVKVYPDLVLNQALESSDICMLGAEAILKNTGAILKTGGSHVVQEAMKYDLPVYICAHTLKFDSKGHMLKILNHQHNNKSHDIKKVYEYIDSKYINAFISDQGIFRPNHIITEIKRHNSEFFR